MSSTPRTDLEVLEKTREILADANSWVKGLAFADSDGKPVTPFYAEKYCLSGAATIASLKFQYDNCLNDDDPDEEEDSILTLSDYSTGQAIHEQLFRIYHLLTDGTSPAASGVISFNDRKETTHQDVLDFLDAGITKLKATTSPE